MNERVGVEDKPQSLARLVVNPFFVIILVALGCHISNQSLSFLISKMGMIMP